MWTSTKSVDHNPCMGHRPPLYCHRWACLSAPCGFMGLPPCSLSAIIILAEESKPDQSDARLIHVVLSLMVLHKELQAEGGGGIKVRGWTRGGVNCRPRAGAGSR